jgi:subtilisin family serine protease
MSLGMDEMLRSVLAPWTPRNIRDEYRDHSQSAYSAAEILVEPQHISSRWTNNETQEIARALQDFCQRPVVASSLLNSFLWLKLPLDFLKKIEPENLYGNAPHHWPQVCNRLRRLGVVRLWPNLPLYPQAAPSSSTSSISRSNFEAQRSLVGAVGQPTDGQSVTWAIVDTEVYPYHEVLQGTSLDRYKMDQTVAAGQQTTTFRPAGSVYQGPSPHGTHVAGIIRLLAPATRLITIALPEITRMINGRPDTAFLDAKNLTLALEWLLKEHKSGTFTLNGVNLSLGQRPEHQDRLVGFGPGCPAVTELCEAGVMVVIAAGNYGDDQRAFQPLSITDPANAYEAIVVGACAKDNPQRYGLCTFSSRGPTADGRQKPDFLAPGLEIASCGNKIRDQYYEDSGTSQAAPFFSGALAILRGAVPSSVSNTELIQILKDTGDRLGRDKTLVGGGLVNVQRALNEAQRRPGWLRP